MSVCMSGQCICQVDVFVRSMCMSIFWLPAPMVAVIVFNLELVKNVNIRLGYQFNLGIIKPWSFV